MFRSNSKNSKEAPSMHKQKTKGVEILLGDPKKAIIKLAWPMIIAMSANTIYNVVDAIWVSGLGRDALSAVGFFFPFFFMVMALATGLGVGGGAAISRRIGAKDKAGADNVAVHTIILMVIISIIFTIPFLILAKPIFILVGAGDIVNLVVSYANIMFAGTIIIFFNMVATSILRAEGDANRSMYVMMFGAFINIILDPIFIYVLGFGVAGAAWATVISMSISSLVMVNWLFRKKDTYVSFNFNNFHWDRKILKDISDVGTPASFQQLSMAVTMLIMNLIIVFVAGKEGIAIYTVGWRVVMIAILPLLGIATAVISVTGAAFGAKRIDKLKTAYYYSIKFGLSLEILVAVLTFIFAAQITFIFTLAEDTARIKDDIILFLQIMCFFYPGVAFGMFSSAMFQGIGKGMNSLIVTLWRTVVLGPPLGIFFAIYLDLALPGVWIGIVLANLIGSITAFIWGVYCVRNLESEFQSPKHIFDKGDKSTFKL
jgi:putative MATE family efflux protein